jgi:hypothetical protein
VIFSLFWTIKSSRTSSSLLAISHSYINIISAKLVNLACSPNQGQDCLFGLDETRLAKL